MSDAVFLPRLMDLASSVVALGLVAQVIAIAVILYVCHRLDRREDRDGGR